MGNNIIRLFYALMPDEETRHAMLGIQAPLKGKITPSENLHLTMAFLGNQPRRLLPEFCDILLRVPVEPIDLVLDQFGYFPGSQIAWAGMKNIPLELTQFHRAISDALAKRKIKYDANATFRPHITVARNIRNVEPRSIAPIAWRAKLFALVQSELPSDANSLTHPIYTTLADRQLDGRSRGC